MIKRLSSVAQIEIPFRASYSTHVFQQYTLKIKDGNRDDFKKFLAEEGIPTMIYYPVPLHLQKAFRRPGLRGRFFSGNGKSFKIVISLPIHTEMSSDQHLEFICDKVKQYFNS